jgi:hypothetical protein
MDAGTELLPGDVVLVRTEGLAGLLIRLGASLLDRPNVHNHVAIVHHRDPSGTLWGIEARPGGVGWIDMEGYLGDPYTTSNADQPKTPQQREQIAAVAESLLQTPYDWAAIAVDAMKAIRADRLWKAKSYGDGEVPAQVVCSSLADYVYAKVGLASPGLIDGDAVRFTTPADWDLFIDTKGWLRAA